MTYAILGLIFVELYFQAQANSAVVGSRQRYVALSLRRVTSWLVDLAFIADGLLWLVGGDQTLALWYISVGIFSIILEVRAHKNDDDWFNGRGTKIKKGIQRMLAAPRQRTSPAFGRVAHDATTAV
jgi:hypothetical protein